MSEIDDILTIEEVAKYLKLKPQTIYTWAQTGKIPAAKLGNQWRFSRRILDQWFLEHFDEKYKNGEVSIE
ncbi:MAG: putative IIA-like nitrogen-regulatory protein PtsN [Ignavibacteria bacterium]|nr:putative IIA-like nitrogen-regulatory protein PtsN [Ignavibacteria bacterium]